MSKTPTSKYHGKGEAAKASARERAKAISGVAYEVDISGPWDGFWSAPDFPHNAPHDPIYDARDPRNEG